MRAADVPDLRGPGLEEIVNWLSFINSQCPEWEPPEWPLQEADINSGRKRRLQVVSLKRAYEPASVDDGQRFLVERLWPRGVKRDSLHIAGWLKEVAPSTNLRKWFSHDPDKWNEFRRRYFVELDAHRDALEPLLDAAGREKITLVYSSHDQEHNNAVALKEYLESKLSHLRPHRKRAA